MSEKPAGEIEVVIEATSEDFDPSDSRWIRQVNELQASLNRDAGDVKKIETPQEGQKGGPLTTILTLASQGGLEAAAGIFKAWVDRDTGRSLKIKVKQVGDEKEIEVTGKGMTSGVIKEFMEEALQQSAGTNE